MFIASQIRFPLSWRMALSMKRKYDCCLHTHLLFFFVGNKRFPYFYECVCTLLFLVFISSSSYAFPFLDTPFVFLYPFLPRQWLFLVPLRIDFENVFFISLYLWMQWESFGLNYWACYGGNAYQWSHLFIEQQKRSC